MVRGRSQDQLQIFSYDGMQTIALGDVAHIERRGSSRLHVTRRRTGSHWLVGATVGLVVDIVVVTIAAVAASQINLGPEYPLGEGHW